MNEQIMKILPARRNYNQKQYETTQEIDTYNECLDDCAAAIEKANLVVCPTEEQVFKLLHNERMMLRFGARSGEGKETDYDLRCIAKALLALLHNNSATQEKI